MGSITEIFDFLQGAIQFVGAGVAIFGGVELFQSFSENNPQAKTIGVKLLASGLIMIAGAEPLISWFQSFLPK